MRFNILVLTNDIPNEQIEDDLTLTKRYFERHTPLTIGFTVKPVEVAKLTHKSFGVFEAAGSSTELYGLDGIKAQLREHVPIWRYQAVIFIYRLGRTDKQIAHWTYFNEILPATEFIEVAFKDEWDRRGDLYRVLTHELLHAFHNRARRKGIATNDTLDVYDKEFEVDAKDGNRARNIDELLLHFGEIARQPLLWTYFRALVALYYHERPHEPRPYQEKPKVSRIDEWAEAIKQFEGWHVGSCSYRGNNPGNVRWSKYQIGTHKCGSSGEFSLFKDYETGMEALRFQLQIAADGRSSVYRADDTLLEFFRKFAPAADNNYPIRYAQFVADRLGINVQTRINTLL